MKKLLLFLFAFAGIDASAQDKFTVSGYIRDASNGEALIGATVYLRAQSSGTTSNVYGFYSLTLPSGAYDVEFTYIGYAGQIKSINLSRNQRIDIELAPVGEELEEVIISAEKEQSIVNSVEMSVNKLDIKTISKIPAFMGEVDVVRSLQQLPGVSTVGEGASGFNVRGGSVGQNLILLDEASVYNSSHMLGFFSVFNPDAVKDTKLYKGAIPAQYGGRLASLLDVRMKEGNSKKLEANGGIGTIFSRLAVESPIVKDKGSFIVAGRRSYVDVLARPFVNELQSGAKLYFYDLTGKVNYTINDRNKVFLSGYRGRDVFFFDKRQGFSWGNATATLRWNKIFNDRLFANFSGIYSKYDYRLQFGEDNLDFFKWSSSITNYSFKPSFSYFINSNNEVSFGVEGIYYDFLPAEASLGSNGTGGNLSVPKKFNLELSAYVGNDQKINDTWSVQYGLRYSSFRSFGPGNKVVFAENTQPGERKVVANLIAFARGKTISQFSNLEPRLSVKAQLAASSSLKASYNRMAQYLHLLSNTTASNPLDLWTPSSNNLRPETGDQFTLGYFRDFGDKRQYEFSVETYYRATKNQVDYIDGAQLFINQLIESDLLSGIGRAYGVEFYLQKKTGRLNGWMSYTLGKTEVKTIGLNNNNWYPARFDQRHNLKLTAFYDINKRWSASANFTFLSGTPITFPTSRLTIQDILIPHISDNARNNFRLPSYHRLDVSFRLEGKKVRANGKERKNSDYWVFGLYNVYGRRNPFSIYFRQNNDVRTRSNVPIESQAWQVSILGSVVPSVSYNFHF